MILSEEMIRYIENHRQEAYSLLLELARIPAPSNHEERRAEFCSDWLKAQGARDVSIVPAWGTTQHVWYVFCWRGNI